MSAGTKKADNTPASGTELVMRVIVGLFTGPPSQVGENDQLRSTPEKKYESGDFNPNQF